MSSEKATSSDSSISSEIIQLTKTQLSDTGEKILHVDMDNIKTVFGNREYKDYHVAIYTIAGPMRTGKSFLLSLLWSFLKNYKNEKSYEQWLNSNKEATKIFEWKRGAKPCTHGIYILRKPIVSEENKVALFLADTQGTFDYHVSEQNQTFLGTFNFLLSSVLIFNVQNRIETTHLDTVYKHAANLTGKDGSFAMEKESLMFVVRDWFNNGKEKNENDCDETKNEQNNNQFESDADASCSSNEDDQEFPFGMEGGKSYLNSMFGNESSNKEHKRMREYMNFAFGENIACYLLPYPGDAVRRKTCIKASLDSKFLQQTFKFFQQFRNKTKIKQIQSKPCRSGELCEALIDYVSVFGTCLNVTDTESFFKKDFKVKMSRHLRSYVAKFINLLSEQSFEKENFEKTLNSCKSEIEKEFRQALKNFGPEKRLVIWEKELQNVLFQVTENLKICFHVEKQYKKAILKYNDWLNNSRSLLEILFRCQAEEKRLKCLTIMKQKICQQIKNINGFEHIFHQCSEFFNIHTNKLTAKLDDDIASFLTEMKSKAITAKILMVDLGSLVVALPVDVDSQSVNIETSVRDISRKITEPQSSAANEKTIKAFEPQPVGQHFSDDPKMKSADKKSVKLKDHLLELYERGVMEVEFSFGTLMFKLQ